MRDRLTIQSELETLLGSRNVYYDPPPSFKLKYDCFVYELRRMDRKLADNHKYLLTPIYQVTYITKNPDSPLIMELARKMNWNFMNSFTKDNLHHFVYEIF